MKVSLTFRWIMWAIFFVAGITFSFITDFFLRKMGFVLGFGFFGRMLGFFLLILSVLISRSTGKTLKKYGHKGKNTSRFDTDTLVTFGPYGCMRHPMHLGLMLMPEGVAFLLNSFSYVIIYAPVNILIIYIMIKQIEEPEAIKKFGSTYFKYMREVPMFNFSLSCIKKLFSVA
ncbi:MAG: isoprenylcysteine carboxylmethyltransferase family protein [Caldisericaceae bacterium]|nr:isoprenylcysteine carboxylmethyltransferase family protein [Caldisericaceae bacterium]RLD21143.1 MAG: isoprenylcysteine carboxylmethyltransferase family protein [Caldisericota bacterium]